MFINQIDTILDKILDNLYLEGLQNDSVMNKIIIEKKKNFVEFKEEINSFIASFMGKIDLNELNQILKNKENIKKIIEIIKRYVAYYYFLYIGVFYPGTEKEYGSNIFLYSELQKTSTFKVHNFFDGENNSQLINFQKILKDSVTLLLLTDLQKKDINKDKMKEAILFLNDRGGDYIEEYIIYVENNEVKVNYHSLIKTIVLSKIYKEQDIKTVYNILDEQEDSQNEYIYIDVVVPSDEIAEYENYKQMFSDLEDPESIARMFYDMSLEEPDKLLTVENKNSNLMNFNWIIPIVDDFLRYHRDTDKILTETDKSFVLPTSQTTKNVQMALMYQQRKKKDNTKAQMIISNIETFSDLYSEYVKTHPDVETEMKKKMYGPLEHRKALSHNHYEELHVMNKIINMGSRVNEGNEYYLELKEINNKAFFNFKDFKNYGFNMFVDNGQMSLMRYSSIEHIDKYNNLFVEFRTTKGDSNINVVGLALPPLDGSIPICHRKNSLVDIRKIKINYPNKMGDIKTLQTDNGYKTYKKILEHLIIAPINVVKDGKHVKITWDGAEILKNNKEISDKIIYWEFDIERDVFHTETYENIKSNNQQDQVKFMVSELYDNIIEILKTKLINLITDNSKLDLNAVHTIITQFCNITKIHIPVKDYRDIINMFYFTNHKHTGKIKKEKIEKIKFPEYVNEEIEQVHRIVIDMRDPTNFETKKDIKTIKMNTESNSFKCQHINDWSEINKLKRRDINEYNKQLTEFISKYSSEYVHADYTCKICGELLSIHTFVADGTYDNNNQKFVTAYVPLDIPLDEMTGYNKYPKLISKTNKMIEKLAFTTGLTMLTGSAPANKNRRKLLTKQTVDIFLKHNAYGGVVPVQQKSRFFEHNFGVDEGYSFIAHFAVDDNIFDTDVETNTSQDPAEIIKINNLLVYACIIFMSDLNGSQILMMNFDKYSNIFTYDKLAKRLFSSFKVRKNINSEETVPITEYPVLCYLIYVVSMCSVKYNIRMNLPSEKKFTDVVKTVIHSIVEIINGISLGSKSHEDDFIYTFTCTKIYEKMNTVFKQKDIIQMLKYNQIRYAEKKEEIVNENEIETYKLNGKLTEPSGKRKLPTNRLGDGVRYYDAEKLYNDSVRTVDSITNCQDGQFHHWRADKPFECGRCGVSLNSVSDNISDRQKELYYYKLSKIAEYRCPDANIHKFDENTKICSLCKNKKDHAYNKNDLDKLMNSLLVMNTKMFEDRDNFIIKSQENDLKLINENNKLFNKISEKYEFDKSSSLRINRDKKILSLIELMGSIMGDNKNIGTEKEPIYLDENVYFIDHYYDGSELKEPLILEGEGKIGFKKNHNHYNCDVYYYTDSRQTVVDVFYDAVSLRLLGYKEKHKDYVDYQKDKHHLIINKSVQEKIRTLGFEAEYLNISDMMNKTKEIYTDEKKNYYNALNNLVSKHVLEIKNFIDKFVTILNKTKNGIIYSDPELLKSIGLQSTKKFNLMRLDSIVSNYSKIFSEVIMGNNDVFNDWHIIKKKINHKNIDWSKTTMNEKNSNFVNIDDLIHYDSAGNMMMEYFIDQIIDLIISNKDKAIQISVCKMIIDTINSLYITYNDEKMRNNHDVKRFNWIMKSDPTVHVDLLRKGRGLEAHIIEMEEEGEIDEEEAEDLREEAEALDVEEEEYIDEGEDYNEGHDEE